MSNHGRILPSPDLAVELHTLVVVIGPALKLFEIGDWLP